MATKIFLNSNKLQIPPGALLHSVRLRTDYTKEELNTDWAKANNLKSPEYTPREGSITHKYNEVAGIINLVQTIPIKLMFIKETSNH